MMSKKRKDFDDTMLMVRYDADTEEYLLEGMC